MLRWQHPEGFPVATHRLDRGNRYSDTRRAALHGGATNLSFGSFRVMETAITRQFRASASVSAHFTYPLLLLHECTGDPRYLDAATRQLDAVLGPAHQRGLPADERLRA